MDPSKRVQNWLWQGTIVDYDIYIDIYIYYTHTHAVLISEFIKSFLFYYFTFHFKHNV